MTINSPLIKKLLLICGILIPIIYIGTDIFAGLLYERYNFLDRAISELSAIGSPTKIIWVSIMSLLFNPLIIAFGVGVWIFAKNNRPLNLTGILLTLWGISGYVWFFFPMNMRGSVGSFSDTMHLVVAGTTVLLMTIFISAGAFALGKSFRLYSLLTLIIMLTFGTLVGMQAPQVAAQLPTHWMGIMERISVYSPMLWTATLAVVLLNKERL